MPEILLFRSLVIILIAGLIGRGGSLLALVHSRQKMALAGRAALILVAWLSYYNAARSLPLAELTTLYFAAPMVAVVLAVMILRERVVWARWIAVLGGFCGVVLAADSRGGGTTIPVLLALAAAFCWGLSVVLVRLISRSETTASQMLVSNVLFAVACLPMVVWAWHTPDGFSLALMLLLGLFGGMGQYALYEGFRYAPASAVAPVEYTGLVWAFLYGYVIWGEVPGPRVVAGAGLIALTSLSLIAYERRLARRLAP